MTEPSQDWSRLLSLLVHELRTPAGVVAGYLRMLQQGRSGALAPSQQSLVEAADRSAARLVEVLDQSSELAALESGETPLTRQVSELGGFLTTLVTRAQASGGEPALTIQGAVPEIEIQADLERLRAAMLTLAAAAPRSAGDPQGVVLRSWEGIGRDDLHVLIAMGSADVVAEVGPKARTTRQPYDCWRGGRGLDLVLAVKVIALHDGEVCMLSVRPGSAVTLVRLPTASGQAA